jgi:hypothetical protein
MKKFFNRVKIVAVGTIATVATVYLLVAMNQTDTILYQKVTEIQHVEAEEVTPAVMERIAECESGNSHYAKSGQIVTNGNTNGTVDIGKYQINLFYWGDKATELELDLTIEEDNEAFALYLYDLHGTEPWIWSKKCWQ